MLEGLTFIHRTYGPFVQTRLPLELYFIADPACVEEILLKKPEAFRKDRTSRLLSRVVGNGLLVNEGDSWRRQRRLLQPAFHHRQLQSYAAVMTGAIEQASATWKPGEVRNVHEDMMAVTLNIVARTLFGADVSADAGHIGQIISELMEHFGRILGLAARFQPPAWVPTPTNRQFQASARKVDQVILQIIDARRKQERRERRTICCRCLIRARDEDGSSMTDAQVRDEAVTLFLAGHETTALALTYSLYLLATHPKCQDRLADELAQVLGGRAPGLGRSGESQVHRRRRAGGDAPLSAGLGDGAPGADRRGDRGLSFRQGGRVRDVPLGAAPRSAQLRRRPRPSSPNAGRAISRSACRGSPTSPSEAARGSASEIASR